MKKNEVCWQQFLKKTEIERNVVGGNKHELVIAVKSIKYISHGQTGSSVMKTKLD